MCVYVTGVQKLSVNIMLFLFNKTIWDILEKMKPAGVEVGKKKNNLEIWRTLQVTLIQYGQIGSGYKVWKAVWHYIAKSQMQAPYDPAIPF